MLSSLLKKIWNYRQLARTLCVSRIKADSPFRSRIILLLSSISKQHSSWLAIFSLLMSCALIWTHHHGGQGCSCGDHDHATSAVSDIEGLENLPVGACECTDCEVPSEVPVEHDEHSCSICRMVYEHAIQTIELAVPESSEKSCDSVAILFSVHVQRIESGDLTRGPPTPLA